jgi:threonine dehydrogenase-like Zn-dependent dehydrogenase
MMSNDFPLPETIIAVRLHGAGFDRLSVDRIPLPRPNADQLLARVDAAGVCASNLKLIAQGSDHTFLNGWDLSQHPIQLGDEGCVTIVESGRNLASRFPVGGRYVIQPAVDVAPIRHRERYRNQAAGMQKVAVGYSLPGHLAEYMIIPEEVIAGECLLPIPDRAMPYFAAALCEPISCVVSAHDRHIHVRQATPFAPREPRLGLLSGGCAMVVGAGPMGRMHAEAALRFRPKHLIVVDIDAARLAWIDQNLRERAQAVGTQLHTVLSAASEALLRQITGGHGADDIIIAVGNPPLQEQAQQWLARGGVLDLFAGLKRGEHRIGLDTLRVHYDEIKVVGSSGGTPADMAATLRLITQGDFQVSRHLALVGSLDQFPRALAMVKNTETEGKIVLYPQIRTTALQPATGWSGPDEEAWIAARISLG